MGWLSTLWVLFLPCGFCFYLGGLIPTLWVFIYLFIIIIIIIILYLVHIQLSKFFPNLVDFQPRLVDFFTYPVNLSTLSRIFQPRGFLSTQ